MSVRSVLALMAGIYVFSLLFYPALSLVWPEVDVPLHLTGGFTAGMLGLACWDVLRRRNGVKGMPAWLTAFLLVCFVALIAVSWELYEFCVDAFNRSRGAFNVLAQQPSVPDTMADLFFGLSGGALSALIFRKRL